MKRIFNALAEVWVFVLVGFPVYVVLGSMHHARPWLMAVSLGVAAVLAFNGIRHKSNALLIVAAAVALAPGFLASISIADNPFGEIMASEPTPAPANAAASAASPLAGMRTNIKSALFN